MKPRQRACELFRAGDEVKKRYQRSTNAAMQSNVRLRAMAQCGKGANTFTLRTLVADLIVFRAEKDHACTSG